MSAGKERWAPWGAALAVALFYSPLVFGQQLYRRDAWRLFVPCAAYVGERLRALEFPAWFPYNGLGLPLHAQAVCGVLHPLTWTSIFLSPELSLSLRTLAGVAAAAWGIYRLARVLGAGGAGSALGAVAYALGGYLVSEAANNLVFLYGAAALPLQLSAFARAALKGWSRADFALALLAGCSTLLVGDLQDGCLFWPFALALGLALAGGRWRGYLVGALACTLLVGLVCAAQLLPTLHLMHWSARAEGLDWEDASYWSLHPLRLPELLLPGLSPVGAAGRARALFGSEPGYLLWAEAVGGSAVASLCALLGLTDASRPRRLRLALGAAAALGLLLALGRFGLYRVLYEAVPLLRGFRWPEKNLPLFLVPFLSLGALGCDRALERGAAAARRACLALAALGALAALAAAALAGAPAGAGAAYCLDLARALGLGAAALAVLAALARARGGWRAPALVLLVALESALSSRPAWDARPLSDSAQPPASAALLRSAGAGLGRMRVIDLGFGYERLRETDLAGPGERRWAALEREGQVALWGGVEHLESVGPYLQGHPEALDALSTPGPDWPRAFAPKFNVGLALVESGARPLVERWGLRWSAEVGSSGIGLYELPGAWPRAYLATPQAFDGRDPLVQLAGLVPGQALVSGWRAPPPPAPAQGTVSVAAYAPEEVRLRAQVQSAGLLVLNDALAPGWSATLDGERAALLPVNLLVRGVLVPEGEHEVVLRYRVPGLAAGLAASALGLALALALLAWRRPWAAAQSK